MNNIITESVFEDAVVEILEELGYQYKYGPDIAPAPEGKYPERSSYSDIFLIDRLRKSLKKINSQMSDETLETAAKKVTQRVSQNMVTNNEAFHMMLTEGIAVESKRKEGHIVWETVKIIDSENLENNDWLAVNQFTIVENRENRRPDVVIFVNGLPLGLIELKNPAEEKSTITDAYNQFQTYKQLIPSIFQFNEVLVIADGVEAQHGTITSSREWFLPWKALDGELAPKTIPQMQVLLQGIFNKRTFLDIIKHFIVFEHGPKEIQKKMAAYHQYHAVNKAILATLKAASPKGDKRCGVIWHTQGSGKSLSMIFYAGKLVLTMDNPTIVVINDRNDLDGQLFDTFSNCQSVLRQKPVMAKNRKDLREQLKVASGGIVFTTIQKFLPEQKGDTYPLLSDRRNIIIIADEAHRSQYDFIDGFARHMRGALPNASFIGFTGTPIEEADRSTPAVFGNYIDIYDMNQAVDDKATVRIYYEARLAKLDLKPDERPKIDPQFEEVTESEEVEKKEYLKTKWARVEKLVGSEKRIKLIANDLVNHFEQRLEAMNGKGMIVCMSRRICVDLYGEIIKLRPAWEKDADDEGFIKVIMTGSASDPVSWQKHIRNKERREALKNRFKDSSSKFKLAIVRDMWLTGLDVPSLHTMYVDKPMRGHGLMQAIARVNRVFKDKPGGLIVDYIGIADSLKKALANYTAKDRRNAGIPQEEAIAVMIEKYEVAKALFHGFDYSAFFKGTPKQRIAVIPAAMEHVLKQEDDSKRFIKATTELSKAFALSIPHEEAIKIRDEVGFFQAIKASLVKSTETGSIRGEELDTAIQQIISKAIVTDKVVDIYAAAGIKTPDISVLSDKFLADVKDIPYKNLAIELLRKLLDGEIRVQSRKNLVKARSFAEMLERAIRKYQNQSLQTAEIIEELIELAKQMKESRKRGEELHLTDEELAFYDALEINDSAVKVLGDQVLRKIAQELADMIRKNVTVDWTIRESVRARLRIMVKRLLNKYGYPPDKQEKATRTVLEQAELFGENIVTA